MTFEEFVSARLGALVRYATVVTWDPHLAEDITQNVLVRAASRSAVSARRTAAAGRLVLSAGISSAAVPP